MIKIKYIVMCVCLLAAFSAVAQQREYQGEIRVTPLQLEQKGDSLYIKIAYDISGVNVDSRRSISLFPVLIAPQKQQALPEIMVKGRNNYKSYARRVALMSTKEQKEYAKSAPYAVVKGYRSGESRVVEYHKVLPYEAWMGDARLDMQEDLCGCGNPPRTMAMSQLINTVQREVLIAPYQVTPLLAYVRPEIEAVKHREATGEAFIDFAVNSTLIRPEYMNNPGELNKITNLIREVKNDPNITVRGISVIGYASPEGTLAGNKKLSEGRAKAMVNYLSPRFDYPVSIYNVSFGGENWQGLKEKIEQSDLAFKQIAIDLIEKIPSEIDYKTQTSRKKALMELQEGVPYRYMQKEIFPSLRKAVCKIDYEVKGFDIADAKLVINKRPQDLSLNEMFLVANTYANGSQEFIDVFELAVRMYPEDQIANLNAASAALARKDIVSAERYLSKIKTKSRIPEYDNAMGVCALLKEDYEKAETYLKAAADTGLEAAQSNLDELARKRQNAEAIRLNKR